MIMSVVSFSNFTEDFVNDLELTEEQQTLLLEEYEKEISIKKHTKQTSPKDISNNNTKNKTTNAKVDKKNKMAQTRDKLNNREQEKKQNRQGTKQNVKSDECGNNLVEDYFGEKDTQIIKDDASANSDESWEKEFDIDEVSKA